MDETTQAERRHYRYSNRRWLFYQLWSPWWTLRTVLGRIFYIPDFVSPWQVTAFAGWIGIGLALQLLISPAAEQWRFQWPAFALNPFHERRMELHDEAMLDTRWPWLLEAEFQPDYPAEFVFGGVQPARRYTPEPTLPQHDTPARRIHEPEMTEREPRDEFTPRTPTAPRPSKPPVEPPPSLALRVQTLHLVTQHESLQGDGELDDSAVSTNAPAHDRSLLARINARDWSAATDVKTSTTESYIERLARRGGRSTTIAPVLLDEEPDVARTSKREIRVEIVATSPALSGVGARGRSELTVINRGSGALQAVELLERLDSLPTVYEAQPPAVVAEGMLLRRIAKVPAGERRTAALDWAPERGGRHEHRAKVVLYGSVYAETAVTSAAPSPLQAVRQPPREVPEPLLQPLPDPPERLRPAPVERPRETPVRHEEYAKSDRARQLVLIVHHRGRVAVGGRTPIDIEVRNDDLSPCENVVVTAELPAELGHRAGKAVECSLGRIESQASQTTRLWLTGLQQGEGASRISVMTDDAAVAAQELVLLVEASRPANRISTPVVRPPCACSPMVSLLGN